jgi:membrane-associated phospholipid phosphatase
MTDQLLDVCEMEQARANGAGGSTANVRPAQRWDPWARVLGPDDDSTPTIAQRVIVFPLLFIPWLVLYEWVVYRGPSPGAFQTYLPGEINWPIWPWMELLYASPYLLVSLAPLCAPTHRVLRRFVIAGAIATVAVVLMFLFIPAFAPPRPFHPVGVLGRMMLTERELDLNNGSAAFPSFHVVWACLGAALFSARWPRLRWVAWSWAMLVAASCVLTGMHSLADIVAGFIVFALAHNYRWARRQSS